METAGSPVLPPPTLPPETVEAVRAIVGDRGLSCSQVDRIAYSRDSWPKALLWARRGYIPHPPDLIAWPADTAQVAALVRLANERRFPIVPYGGGSGVCGGAIPLHGGLVLDLKRMDRFLALDEPSLAASAQAGLNGQRFEDELARRGYTCGHFPSSIYCSTVGGWLAARSAGQCSTRYGKIEDMVIGLEAVLPSGVLYRTRPAPRRATGPDLVQLLVGSEGTLGVITAATLRVWPAPEAVLPRGLDFRDLESGLDAMRRVLRAGIRPAATRLYDELDTMLVGEERDDAARDPPRGFSVAALKQRLKAILPEFLSDHKGLFLARPALTRKLAARLKGRCLMVLTFEGDRRLVTAERDAALEICAQAGGRDRGEGPGRHWLKHRHDVSYRQSELFGDGFFVDTMEVAAPWSSIAEVYRAVRAAVGDRVFVMAHFSHAYPEGCSVYFSMVGKGKDGEEIERNYDEVWDLAMEAALQAGANLSHHHGVGLSKARFMEREHGAGLEVLRALKRALDPRGVMNPGKLGLDEPVPEKGR